MSWHSSLVTEDIDDIDGRPQPDDEKLNTA